VIPVLADLQEFIGDHRPHGTMTVEATEPGPNGYLITIACPCGVLFGRWVTSLDAESDLISWAKAN